MARTSPTPPCWKCSKSHGHSERIYYCSNCSAALCFEELYAADHGLEHDSDSGYYCGPVTLLTELVQAVNAG